MDTVKNGGSVLLEMWKKNNISNLYAKGSYYYLAYKFFRLKDLNLNLIKCYIKLFFYFFYNSFKKISNKFK